MREIQIIICHLHDTLEEAHEYYRDYIIYGEDSELGKMAFEMARTHLNLYLKWHKVIESYINDIDIQPPETMIKLWNFEHEKLVEEYEELKYKLKM